MADEPLYDLERIKIEVDVPHGGIAEEYGRIVWQLHEVGSMFLQKAQDYDPSVYKFLGVKGQFSDITRKYLKLKSVAWDGTITALVNEDLVEVIDDMIGHLLIMRYMIAEEAL
jgi:hypothetical protein